MRPRELIALFTAPLVPGVLHGALMGNLGALIAGVLFAYAFAALVGLPTLFLLRRCGWNTLSNYLLAGAVAGGASGLVLGSLAGYSNFSLGSTLGGMLFFIAYGLIVSMAYWLLACSGTASNSRQHG